MAFQGGWSNDRSNRLPPPNYDNNFGFPSSRNSAIISPPSQFAAQVAAPIQEDAPSRLPTARRFTESDHTLAGQSEPFSHHQTRTLEQRLQEIEQLKQQTKKYEQDLRLLQEKQKQSEEEIANFVNGSHGGPIPHGAHPQSEPTTPPEYNESVFPTAFSRPNRFSASMVGSAGFIGSNRPSRAASQLTSPSAALASTPFNFSQPSTNTARMSWKSVPGSRRNSDEEEDFSDQYVEPISHKSAGSKNRNSMPATASAFRGRNDRPDISSVLSYGHQINTTKFLFGDEESEKPVGKKDPSSATSPDVNSYLLMNTTDDKFPILIRGQNGSDELSAGSAALDLAYSDKLTSAGRKPAAWSSFGRRQSPQKLSLPSNTFPTFSQSSQLNAGPQTNPTVTGSTGTDYFDDSQSTPMPPSLEKDFGIYGEKVQNSNSVGMNASTQAPPKLQSSYSTSDIPTVKNGSKAYAGYNPVQNSHAEQHLQNHNANLGRIPSKVSSARQSRELSGSDVSFGARLAHDTSLNTSQSGLKGNAAPFGPTFASPTSLESEHKSPTQLGIGQYAQQPSTSGYAGSHNATYPGGFKPQAQQQTPRGYSTSGPEHQQQQFANAAVGGVASYAQQQSATPNSSFGNQIHGFGGIQSQQYYQTQPYANFLSGYQPSQIGAQQAGQFGSQYGAPFGLQSALSNGMMVSSRQPGFPANRIRDNFGSQNVQRRRDEMESQRYANVELEQCGGQIYTMARDQHGCRFLQKKLEERKPGHINMIFDEVHLHIVELMTDPFGNYVCQKLLEFSNDEQRTVLIRNASADLVRIALNQHGTRALQKMIENVSTREQVTKMPKIELVINALRNEVVEMIQDLNGNHVVQKCLNHLQFEDSQFIFDSVCKHIITIGTHRHGCCVIQRCLDHSTPEQKQQLVETITEHSYSLNEDPFGNYVTQYLLDMTDPKITETLIARFRHRVVAFSKHKFSSNVIEKCIRIAKAPTRRWMFDEMLQNNELEKMTRDHYANYVIQTAIEWMDPELEMVFMERVRAVVPSIRSTPHGRRIAAKLQTRDQRNAERETAQKQGRSYVEPPIPTLGRGEFRNRQMTNESSNPGSRRPSQPTSRDTSRPVSSHESSMPESFRHISGGENPELISQHAVSSASAILNPPASSTANAAPTTYQTVQTNTNLPNQPQDQSGHAVSFDQSTVPSSIQNIGGLPSAFGNLGLSSYGASNSRLNMSAGNSTLSGDPHSTINVTQSSKTEQVNAANPQFGQAADQSWNSPSLTTSSEQHENMPNSINPQDPPAGFNYF